MCWNSVLKITELHVHKFMTSDFIMYKYFYPPIERFGGYSDEPGVHPSFHFLSAQELENCLEYFMILHSYVEKVITMGRI